jgi:hypothetical protein
MIEVLVVLAAICIFVVPQAVLYRRTCRSELPSEAFNRLYRPVPRSRPADGFAVEPGARWGVCSSASYGAVVMLASGLPSDRLYA